jgi:hypothetical protein
MGSRMRCSHGFLRTILKRRFRQHFPCRGLAEDSSGAEDQTLDELMSTITDINEGFAQINEAEGRVNTLNVNAENGTAQANIKENMEFIQLTLAANKSKIEALEKKVKEGGRVSANCRT